MKAVVKDELGQVLQVFDLTPKTFRTGSRGYHGQGKTISVIFAGRKSLKEQKE